MPLPVLRAYLRRLPGLIAERKLALSEVAAFGNADERGRRRLLDAWQAESRRAMQAPKVSKAEWLQQIAAAGIPLVVERAKGGEPA